MAAGTDRAGESSAEVSASGDAVGAEHVRRAAADRRTDYVLATLLSRVCSLLTVDPIRDWNLDQPDTWGAVGHFSIAARTEVALSGAFQKLSTLIKNNREIIGHDDATILTDDFKGMGDADFVPLADVPDFYWKHGKQGASRGSEGPNHVADMDQPGPGGQTLLDISGQPEGIDPDGRLQYQRLLARTDHGHGDGDEPRELRHCNRPRDHSAHACLFHQSVPHPYPAEAETKMRLVETFRFFFYNQN